MHQDLEMRLDTSRFTAYTYRNLFYIIESGNHLTKYARGLIIENVLHYQIAYRSENEVVKAFCKKFNLTPCLATDYIMNLFPEVFLSYELPF